jgi:hypothetical protein
MRFRARHFDKDPIRAIHQGRGRDGRFCEAGHMTAADHAYGSSPKPLHRGGHPHMRSRRRTTWWEMLWGGRRGQASLSLETTDGAPYAAAKPLEQIPRRTRLQTRS